MATDKLSGTASTNPYGASNTDSYTETITKQYADAVAENQKATDANVASGQETLGLIGKAGDAAYQETFNTVKQDYKDAKAVQSGIEQNNGNRQGIGHSQYGIAENTYDVQKASIEAARAQLQKDVSRQVADLKAQGEYAKADAALQAAQQQFQQMYADALRVDTNLRSNYEYQTGLQREDESIQREQDQNEIAWLRKMGEALMAKGVTPPDNMLSAMGIDSAAAANYINAVVGVYGGYSGGGGGGGSGKTSDTEDTTSDDAGGAAPSYSKAYNVTIANNALANANAGNYQLAYDIVKKGYSAGQFSVQNATMLYNMIEKKEATSSKKSSSSTSGTKSTDYWMKYYG